jgi:protein-tyrosine phosphatase
MVHNFNPAANNEPTVFGCAAPGFPYRAGGGVQGWLQMIQRFGVKRVVCLLSEDQVLDYRDLLLHYRDTFGPRNVLWAPLPDHQIAPLPPLRDTILPFLAEADAAKERVVVHCLAGLGRTGQVLAAWLIHARGYSIPDALASVRSLGREPDEALRHGNAVEGDLEQLLQAIADASTPILSDR